MSNQMPVACFAPPLTDKLLEEYRALVEGPGVHAQVRDVLRTCLKAVELWWKLPVSKRRGKTFQIKHRGKDRDVPVVPLEHEHVAQLWDAVPWPEELPWMEQLLDGIDTVSDRKLRNAAFHLLWFTKELALDREPLTKDVLK